MIVKTFARRSSECVEWVWWSKEVSVSVSPMSGGVASGSDIAFALECRHPLDERVVGEEFQHGDGLVPWKE